MRVVTRRIRDYVSRDWQAVRDSKDAYWAERIARLGPGEGIRIADELRRQMLQLHPGWPGDGDRRDDLLAHVRLSELLRRGCHTRGG
jgi:hypothetical protein